MIENKQNSVSTERVPDVLLPHCKCGHDRHHPNVQAQGEYTALGYFFQIFGITYKPIKVKYLCLNCNQTFDETADPKVLNNFV